MLLFLFFTDGGSPIQPGIEAGHASWIAGARGWWWRSAGTEGGQKCTNGGWAGDAASEFLSHDCMSAATIIISGMDHKSISSVLSNIQIVTEQMLLSQGLPILIIVRINSDVKYEGGALRNITEFEILIQNQYHLLRQYI